MKNPNGTVVITGVNSGIGLALTQKFLDENYHVIGTTRSGKLDKLTHENLEIVALELSDKESIDIANEEISKLSGEIKIVINNAGIAPDVAQIVPDITSFNQTISTNLSGTVFFTEEIIKLIVPGGKLIFMTSDMGLPRKADANGPAYRISKAGINMYAAILAKRLGEQNVSVNPMHPGWVKTKLGGDQAPLTAEQAAENLYKGIMQNKQSGKFWNTTIPGIEDF